MKRFAGLLASAVCATATLVGSLGSEAAAQDKKYTIYLSNNFIGNDWRQQMERVAEVSVNKGPLAGRVDLKIENVENTVQAQINSLNNIIRAKPDAILVDAGSAEALNPTIKKACDAGIVVISFDQVVTEPCAYALESDWNRIPAVLAEWMAVQLGGKGKVFVDRGLAGAPISAQLENGYLEVLKKYPDIEVIGNYNGEYALGPEQAGVASLLAAHPAGRRHPDPGLRHRRHQGAAGRRPSDRARHRLLLQRHRDRLRSRPKARSASSAPTRPTSRRRRSGSRSTSSTASRSPPTVTSWSTPTSCRPIRSSPSSIPRPSCRRSRSARTHSRICLPGLTLPITPDWVEITAEEAAGS